MTAFSGDRIRSINQTMLNQNLIYIMQLVGLNVMPDKIKMSVLEDWIRSEYGNFTINELK
jgi:hypothetical protein